MPRKGHIPKREVMPDPKYHDIVVTKLVNNVMLDGKKGTAQRIVYGAFELAEKKVGQDAMDIFRKAVSNIMPVLEVKARRVGGATYQVPMEVRPERRQTLALRWMVNFARARNEKTMIERLGNEIVDAFNNTGASVRRKEEMHRAADANKAFAHYRY
uniref:30S ribosomal protein S7 n=1 Tax=Ndongobacter massiliensis TaxID=1871025 RepID=UPI00093166E1|nr:30S ribosomal protein S7 [Ndongobacter massiliensis]